MIFDRLIRTTEQLNLHRFGLFIHKDDREHISTFLETLEKEGIEGIPVTLNDEVIGTVYLFFPEVT